MYTNEPAYQLRIRVHLQELTELDKLHHEDKGNDEIRRGFLQWLQKLIDIIRPRGLYIKGGAEVKIGYLISALEKDEILLKHFRNLLFELFVNVNLTELLSSSGISESQHIFQEFGRIMRHKLLPDYSGTDNARYILHSVFVKKKDVYWVNEVDNDTWNKLFTLVGVNLNVENRGLKEKLIESFSVLSYKVAGVGIEKEISSKVRLNEYNVDPFISQNREVNKLLDLYIAEAEEAEIIGQIRHIHVMLTQCEDILAHIRKSQRDTGTSLMQTYSVNRCASQIFRMKVLIEVLNPDKSFDMDNFVRFFKSVIEYEKTRNSFRRFFKQNIGHLAYQISEHGGRHGEHYMTTTPKEFKQFFMSACGAGFIIVFIALYKILLHKLNLAPFWEAFVYGFNYALGFVAIMVMGTTLATKQPSMTAAAIAESMDSKKHGQPNLTGLVISFAKVSRSQLAALVGNLVVVIPFGFLIAYIYDLIFGFKIVDGAAAVKILEDIHPTHSKSLWYAAITGFYLFLSGIIAGYVDNKIIYARIKDRIIYHPGLRQLIPEKSLIKIADYISENAGSLAGNISLGFFLGSAGYIGSQFGIPWDIRHVTIAGSNFSFGLYGLGNALTWKQVVVYFTGVVGIGLVNLISSFSLAFYVALQSRNVSIGSYPKLFHILWKYFRQYPKDFWKPPLLSRDPDILAWELGIDQKSPKAAA